MNCRDVRELADSFLAHELPLEANQEISRHLETCSTCAEELSARRAFREGLRHAVRSSRELGPTPEFVVHLRSRLQDAAREDQRRHRTRLQGWWVIAATLLMAVAIGTAYFGRDRFFATDALARDAVGDHRNCALKFRLAEKPISLAEAARRYGAAYRVLETLPPDAVKTAIGPARVLERHACVFGGRRFAHIVLEYRSERISLLVTEHDAGVQPDAPGGDHAAVTAGRPIDDMSVAFFRTPRFTVFLTGEIGQQDLVTLADAVAEPLARGLSGA